MATPANEIITVRRYNNIKTATLDHVDWTGTFNQALAKWGMYLAKGKANAKTNDKLFGKYFRKVNNFPKTKEDLIVNLNNAALNLSIQIPVHKEPVADYVYELVE